MRTFNNTKPYDYVIQYASESQYGVCSGFTSLPPYVSRTLTEASSSLLVDEQGLNAWVESLPLPYLSGMNLDAYSTNSGEIYNSTPSKNTLWYKSLVLSGAMVPYQSDVDADTVSLYATNQTSPGDIINLSNINMNGGVRCESTRVRASDFIYTGGGYANNYIPCLRNFKKGVLIQKIIARQREQFSFPESDGPDCATIITPYYTNLGIGIGSSNPYGIGDFITLTSKPGESKFLPLNYNDLLYQNAYYEGSYPAIKQKNAILVSSAYFTGNGEIADLDQAEANSDSMANE